LRLNSKALGALGLAAAFGTTALWAGVSFAAAAPGAVTLTGSSIQASPGGSVTFTANAVGVTNPEYQFWVELPSGKWVDAQNYSTSNTFVLSNVVTGNYLVDVDVMTPAQIAAGDWSQAISTLSDGVFVNSTVALSLSTSNPANGVEVMATASATNIYDPLYQFWWETPDGTWHQSGDYTAANTFTIPAFTQQGSFKVVAYAKSPLAVNDDEGALISNVMMGSASVSTITATLSSAPTSKVTGITATFDQSGSEVATEPVPVGDYNATNNSVVFSPPSTLAAGTYTVMVMVETENGTFMAADPITYTQG
jgi:hypothetical protein